MFSVENNVTDVKIREKKPFKVLFSMNVHQVANPEMSLEDARSCVFFCREGGGKVAVFVGLHFLVSNRKLFYSHSGNPFSEGQLADIEDEARRFAEDLGAVLDEKNFSKMSGSEKEAWIANLEILSGKKREEEKRQEHAPAETKPQPANTAAQNAAVPGALPQPVPVQVSPVQPAPVAPAQAAPEQPQPVQASPASKSGPAPSKQAQIQANAQTPSAPLAVPQAPLQPARKTAGQRQANDAAAAPSPEGQPPAQAADNLLQEAVKAGVVKAPKAQLKKDIRTAAGLISREKEALARLLASF